MTSILSGHTLVSIFLIATIIATFISFFISKYLYTRYIYPRKISKAVITATHIIFIILVVVSIFAIDVYHSMILEHYWTEGTFMVPSFMILLISISFSLVGVAIMLIIFRYLYVPHYKKKQGLVKPKEKLE